MEIVLALLVCFTVGAVSEVLFSWYFSRLYRKELERIDQEHARWTLMKFDLEVLRSQREQ